MKTLELYKTGDAHKAFRIAEKDIPRPEAHEVLIKVHYSGINFADILARRGLYPDAPANPSVIGYDVMGTIEEVGSDVTEVQAGDKVTALTRFGGYAEYVCTMADGVAKIPDSIDEAESTAYATQACTALFCAKYKTRLRKEYNVLIHAAAGGVGSILVQLAKHHGCTIYGTASQSKLAYLEELGVHHPIGYRNKSFYEETIKIAGVRKIHAAFDSIGGNVFKQSMKLLAPCGDMITYGAASQLSGSNKIRALTAALGFGFFSPIQLLMGSRSIIAVNMLRVADNQPGLFKEVLDEVINYAEKGIIKAKVSKIFAAEDIADAHAFVESRKSIGKVVLKW